MSEIRKLLDILTTGSPEEYKKAKGDLSKLWRGKDGNLLFNNSADIVFEYINNFDGIKEIKNKEAFIAGLDLFYLVLSDEHFDRLKQFTLKTIQNSHGHIRKAIVQTSDWLFVSLSSRMKPYVYSKGKELTNKQKEDQMVARNQYHSFIDEVEKLLSKYHLEENERVKYIESMKPSVEKSLQMLWSRLTDLSKHCTEHPKWILDKRKEIRKKLNNIITKHSANIDLRTIEDIIFDEDGYKDMTKLLNNFKNIKSVDELNKITQIFNDAWNYFPHRCLLGFAPAEKRLEVLN